MKTSNEILNNNIKFVYNNKMSPGLRKAVIKSMKEFCIQFIEAAADECGNHANTLTPWAIQDRIKELIPKAKHEEKWKSLA